MKVPAHEFGSTVNFYESILGLKRKSADSPDKFETVVFEFGDKNLWVDKIPGISQAEIWLEIEADDIDMARAYLEARGCVIRNEIEPLPEGFKGFWLNSPSNIIHLVVE